MKLDTVVDGLSDLINDYIEGNIDTITAEMLEEYFEENAQLAAFVRKAQKGKQATNKAYQVKAADDFEEKLAKKIDRVKAASEKKAG